MPRACRSRPWPQAPSLRRWLPPRSGCCRCRSTCHFASTNCTGPERPPWPPGAWWATTGSMGAGTAGTLAPWSLPRAATAPAPPCRPRPRWPSMSRWTVMCPARPALSRPTARASIYRPAALLPFLAARQPCRWARRPRCKARSPHPPTPCNSTPPSRPTPAPPPRPPPGPNPQPQTTPPATQAQAEIQATLAPWAPQPLRSASAALRAVNLAALWPQAPATQLHGRLTAGPVPGQAARWSIEAQLRNTLAGPWDRGRLPVSALQASASYDGSRWSMPGATIEFGAGSATAQGQYLPATGALQGQALLRALRPDALHSLLAAAPLSGHVDAQMQGPTLRFDADIRAAPAASTDDSTPLRINRLSARGSWQTPSAAPTGASLRLDGAGLRSGGASLRLEHLLLDALQARIEASDLRVAPGAQSAEGQFMLTMPGASVQAQGQIAPRNGAGELQLHWSDTERHQRWLTSLPWVGAGLQRALQGTAQIKGAAQVSARWKGGWQTLAQQLQAASAGTALPGSQPTFELQATLSSAQLDLAWPSPVGTGSAAAAGQGRRGLARQPADVRAAGQAERRAARSGLAVPGGHRQRSGCRAGHADAVIAIARRAGRTLGQPGPSPARPRRTDAHPGGAGAPANWLAGTSTSGLTDPPTSGLAGTPPGELANTAFCRAGGRRAMAVADRRTALAGARQPAPRALDAATVSAFGHDRAQHGQSARPGRRDIGRPGPSDRPAARHSGAALAALALVHGGRLGAAVADPGHVAGPAPGLGRCAGAGPDGGGHRPVRARAHGAGQRHAGGGARERGQRRPPARPRQPAPRQRRSAHSVGRCPGRHRDAIKNRHGQHGNQRQRSRRAPGRDQHRSQRRPAARRPALGQRARRCHRCQRQHPLHAGPPRPRRGQRPWLGGRCAAGRQPACAAARHRAVVDPGAARLARARHTRRQRHPVGHAQCAALGGHAGGR